MVFQMFPDHFFFHDLPLCISTYTVIFITLLSSSNTVLIIITSIFISQVSRSSEWLRMNLKFSSSCLHPLLDYRHSPPYPVYMGLGTETRHAFCQLIYTSHLPRDKACVDHTLAHKILLPQPPDIWSTRHIPTVQAPPLLS